MVIVKSVIMILTMTMLISVIMIMTMTTTVTLMTMAKVAVIVAINPHEPAPIETTPVWLDTRFKLAMFEDIPRLK